MYKLYEKYKEKREMIYNINHPLKEMIMTGIASFIIALVVVMGPIALLCNLFIFYDAINYVIIGLVLCFFILIYLTRIFYFQGLSKKECGSLKEIYIFELIGALLITLMVAAIVLI